ncbi:hypothetical protein [Minwuia sp.]|uniref:hypothetical protein n=1 Tax=Minwuia sp. TaxID=2493630 RepID=UPI003A93BC02
MTDIFGTAGDDVLTGTADRDTISGLAGDDHITTNSFRDRAFGGDGDDTLRGSGSTVILNGDGGNDLLVAVTSTFIRQDTLFGGAGDDTLIAGNGGAALVGGDGRDLFILDGRETRIVDFDIGNDRIDLSRLDLTLTFAELTAPDFSFLQNGILRFAPSINTSAFLRLQDVNLSDLSEAHFIGLAQSPDEPTVSTGTNDADDILGTDGADVIDGQAGPDTIGGQQGDDSIIGGAGADQLRGGKGDDSLFGGIGTDRLRGDLGDDLLDGGEGTFDVADYFNAQQGISADLAAGTATGAGNDTLVGIERLEGGDFDDTLRGDVRDNVIAGAGGDDIMDGRGGDDLFGIDVGTGDDTVIGGEGDDRLLIVNQDGGALQVRFLGSSLTLNGTQVISLDDLETLEIRNEGATTINSNSPSILEISLGVGDDVYAGGNGSGHTVSGGLGDDQIRTSSGDDSLDGGDGDDVLNASSGRDTLLGGAGNDTLIASSGDGDQLFGGNGDDILGGGSDSQSFFGGAGNDTITTGTGTDLVDAGEGDDHITASGDGDIVSAGSGNDFIRSSASNSTNYGGDGDDEIVQSGVNNLVDGGAGADNLQLIGANSTVRGGAGDDLIRLGSRADTVVAEAAMDQDRVISFTVGQDRIDVTAFSPALDFSALNISDSAGNAIIDFGNGDVLRLDGVDATALSAADFVGLAPERIPTNGDDDLTDKPGDDLIFLLDGDDTLVSHSGNDLVFGGNGNDSISVAGTSERELLIAGDAGDDTLSISGDVTGSSTVIGADGADLAAGGGGRDLIFGGNGDDTLDGGAGQHDKLTGGDGADTFVVRAGNGDDIIRDFTSGEDRIDVSDLALDLAFSDLQIQAIGGNTHVDFGNGDSLLLYHTAPDDLSADDFIGLNVPVIPGQNLLANGSFELDSDGSVLSAAGFRSSADLFGWDVISGDGVDLHGDGNGVAATDGHFVLDMGETLPGDVNLAIGQDVAGLSAGTALQLSFDIQNKAANTSHTAGNPDSAILEVFWNGERVARFDDPPLSPETQVLNVVAGSGDGSNRLEFHEVGHPDNCGTGLDNVRLIISDGTPPPDPEPIIGTEAADVIAGTDGDDTIDARGGPDAVDGRGGDDSLSGGKGADTLTGGAGDDSLFGGIGTDRLRGGDGNDLLDGGEGDFDVADFFDAQGGIHADLAAGTAAGAGSDTLVGIERLEGGDFDDTLQGDNADNVIAGAGGDDIMEGRDGDDLFGVDVGTGDDTINGGAGRDTLLLVRQPGQGGDQIVITRNNDIVATGPDQTGSGGDRVSTASIEAIEFRGSDFAETFRAHNFGGDLSISMGAGDDVVVGSNSGGDLIDGGAGNDLVMGESSRDFGLGTSDTLSGGAGQDTISGQSGDDILDGGADDDSLYGGAGADRFVFGADSGDDIIFDFTSGEDVIDLTALDLDSRFNELEIARVGSSARIDLGDGNRLTLSGIDPDDLSADDFLGLVEDPGSTATDGDDLLTDTAGDEFIFALAGNDTIRSLFGDDSLFGGAGDDEIRIDMSGDGRNVLAAGDDGDDLILRDITGFGSGNTTLIGGAGNDTLLVAGGSDDEMFGGDGNDVLFDEGGGAFFDAGAGDDTLHLRSGIDTAFGGDGNDRFETPGSGDTIDGGRGDDTIIGFERGFTVKLGEDFGDDVIEAFDPLGDRIDLTALDLDARFEDLAITDTDGDILITFDEGTLRLTQLNVGQIGADNFLGLLSSEPPEPIIGTAGDDALSGADPDELSNGADNVSGLAGADTLDGLGGDDRLYGGDGNDLLSGGAGTDLVYGGADDDTLNGGTGRHDKLTGGAGSDLFAFNPGDGADIIRDFTTGEDRIDLSAFDLDATFDDLNLQASGPHAFIDMGSGDSLLLYNVASDTLVEDDFIF